jgi:hypothetical protein
VVTVDEARLSELRTKLKLATGVELIMTLYGIWKFGIDALTISPVEICEGLQRNFVGE